MSRCSMLMGGRFTFKVCRFSFRREKLRQFEFQGGLFRQSALFICALNIRREVSVARMRGSPPTAEAKRILKG